MPVIKTIPQAAKFAHVSISTIKKGLRQKFIIRTNGLFDPIQLMAGIHAQASRRGGRQLSDLGGMPPDLVQRRTLQADEDLKLTIAKRKEVEYRLAILENGYIPRHQFSLIHTTLVCGLRDAFHGLPAEVAAQASMQAPREVARILREKIDAVLTEFARQSDRAEKKIVKETRPT
jgi:hypothetical protein